MTRWTISDVKTGRVLTLSNTQFFSGFVLIFLIGVIVGICFW